MKETDLEAVKKLTDDEIIARADTLANKLLFIETLKDNAKREAKKWKDQIDAELEEAGRLARVIAGQEELRKQGDLPFGETEAQQALAKVETTAQKGKGKPFPEKGGKGAPAQTSATGGAKKQGGRAKKKPKKGGRPTVPGGAP